MNVEHTHNEITKMGHPNATFKLLEGVEWQEIYFRDQSIKGGLLLELTV